MTPYPSLTTELVVEEIEYLNQSYDLKPEKIQGFVKDLEALKQSIAKRIGTQRFDYPIYSFNYGVDWRSLMGKSPEYYRPEAKRMIEESLMQDNRVISVSDFEFEFGFNHCHISFKVQSIFGSFREETEALI